ncbi:hypothetical protein PsAD37_04252 [Pseudovibrio sp. Ad37]|nr:hypothetical protein PsAD37_04252 [Pseudovibrio sp. Ad37]
MGHSGREFVDCRALRLSFYAGIPQFELLPERSVQRPRTGLQQEMRARFGPAHLLTFAKALADNRIHRAFDKTGRDPLAVTPALRVVGPMGT